MSANLAQRLAEIAASQPGRLALLHGETRITYTELGESALRFAGLLRANGVGPGDRVGLLLPNVPEYVAAYYGALQLGSIVVPLNLLLRHGEIEDRARNAELKVVVGPARPARGARRPRRRPARADRRRGRGTGREPVARDPADLAVLLYTSGTTGGAEGRGADARRHEFDHALFLARPLLRLTPDYVLLGPRH